MPACLRTSIAVSLRVQAALTQEMCHVERRISRGRCLLGEEEGVHSGLRRSLMKSPLQTGKRADLAESATLSKVLEQQPLLKTIDFGNQNSRIETLFAKDNMTAITATMDLARLQDPEQLG